MMKALDFLPKNIRSTALVRLFGFFKVPVLFYLRPKVLILDEEQTVICIPLNRRTKNHLGCMYFGVLCCGADLAAGLLPYSQILESEKNVALSFKDVKGNFLKRAESDTYFTCSQGHEIRDFMKKVIESGERQNLPLKVIATCPDSPLGNEPVAEFELTLSLKLKN